MTAMALSGLRPLPRCPGRARVLGYNLRAGRRGTVVLSGRTHRSFAVGLQPPSLLHSTAVLRVLVRPPHAQPPFIRVSAQLRPGLTGPAVTPGNPLASTTAG